MTTPLDLFDLQRDKLIESEQPLAARMRPRTLDEYIGQDHIVGPGRLLRRAIQADQLSSVIFYGPPGTGKTTLARVIANTTSAHFIALNAVLAGVKDIRESIDAAESQRGLYGRKTILFVDEVHRFNRAQQDALLPHVENGTVILIGATTENPYFSVNRPLVSRSRIFQLKPLTEDDLYGIAHQALDDPERGYGKLNVVIDDDALAHLVDVANGDARALLNALELAVETTPPAEGDRLSVIGNQSSETDHRSPITDNRVIHVTLAVAEESIQQRAVLYDKEGDYHFDTISAYIKSLRGSDPDAALYWLAKMVYAGEDPRFMFRRMLIFAGEDVGLADPNALRVVVAAAEAFDRVGLPEGRFHLTTATLYLATAPKSNSSMGFFDALGVVENERDADVPTHLRDANRDKEGFGHGEGYLYPHAYRDHWVAQQYLPESMQGKVFYKPGDQGYEKEIRLQVVRRREAQLAAMIEGEGVGPPEVLTFTGDRAGRNRDQWLERTVSGAGQRLAAVRDRVLDAARIQRHHLLLDLNAASGLLTWEALRRAPEGGVVSLARSPQDADALRQQAERLPDIERPRILNGDINDLPDLLATLAARPSDSLLFDAIVGRNALTRHADKPAAAALLASMLAASGAISLAETVPSRTQRLYKLVDLTPLGADLARRVEESEEGIYSRPEDPMVNWDEDDLRAAFAAAGLEVTIESQREESEVLVTAEVLARWFTPGAASGRARPSYADHLRALLNEEELTQVGDLFRKALLNRPVPWKTTTAFITAH
ncbi:MAG: AAA family ATPase [Anaerolineae bacterium]|nr:AAA family ATPase [Anaerolineae bacterium]